jgi:hypothetical protein
MSFLTKLFGNNQKNSTSKSIRNKMFTNTDALMEEDRFWKIIERTKENSNNDYEKQQSELESELRKLTLDELILFGNRFRYFRGHANTWELWGAIYIIHGGCGDDSFNDFREWVIGQGKFFYYKTTKDPETLSELDPEFIEETSEFEGLGYIPSKVFEDRVGEEMEFLFQENNITTGKEWNENTDDLKIMFPKIYAKYPFNI